MSTASLRPSTTCLIHPSPKGIAYDDLNRLVQVAEGIPVADGGTQLPIEDYAYDEEGNRVASHLSAFYATNDHNQLVEAFDYNYTYDVRGNRVSQTSKANGALETFGFDSQNRLIEYASSTKQSSYAFDALGRRINKTVDEEAVYYIYDTSRFEDGRVEDDIAMEFDESSALTRRWLHSNQVDEQLAYELYSDSPIPGSGSTKALFEDRQGSIIAVVSEANDTIETRISYDSYGNPTFSPELQEHIPFAYNGREFDLETSTLYLRYRNYDPKAGTFLQKDPLEFGSESLNLYRYVENNPLNLEDPLGLASSNIDKARLDSLTISASGRASTRVIAGIMGRSALLQGRLGSIRKGLSFLRNASGPNRKEKAGEMLMDEIWACIREYYKPKTVPGVSKGRKPDCTDIHQAMLIEAKNVARQGFTKQLKDYSKIARENGMDFVLFLPNSKTTITRELQKAVDKGLVTIVRLAY